MTSEPPPARKPFLRAAAPAITLAGVVLLSTGLFLVGVLATDVTVASFEPAGDVVVENGTARVTYAITGTFRIPPGSYLEGSWRFPVQPGTAFVVDCFDLEDLVEHRTLRADAVQFRDQQEGSFRVPVHQVIRNPFEPQPPSPAGEPSPPPMPPVRSPYCPGLYFVLEWPAGEAGWEANTPEARAEITRGQLFTTPVGRALGAITLLGALAAIGGGLAWREERRARGHAGRAGADESTAETLLLLVDRSEAWLVRTRRYLLIAGVLGIFLWYPLLVPWAWRAGERALFAPWAPPAFAALAAAFLLGLTALWARELRALDRELAEWRDRLARFKRREQELLDDLER